MKWEPWEEFKATPETLPIPAPPCPSCRFWSPQRIFLNVRGHVSVYDGVRLCHSDDMYRDFSCFVEKTDG